MKFLPTAAFVLAALTCSSLTHAGDFYIQGQLGVTEFEFDEDDDLFTAIAFGWAGSKNFAMEVAYSNYGEYFGAGSYELEHEDGSKEDIDYKLTHEIYSVVLAGIGKMNITESFYLTGKIGFDFWGMDLLTETLEFAPVKDTDSGTDLFMGFGLIYDLSKLSNFTDGVAISFEYQMHDFDKIDADVWTGGISYTF